MLLAVELNTLCHLDVLIEVGTYVNITLSH